MSEEIPVVGMREPCPCGSGKRYKACHGKAASRAATRQVRRPFEGLPSECDWVAFREIVPAATAPLALQDGGDRSVTLTTVLPLAWPALVRAESVVPRGQSKTAKVVLHLDDGSRVVPRGGARAPRAGPRPLRRCRPFAPAAASGT